MIMWAVTAQETRRKLLRAIYGPLVDGRKVDGNHPFWRALFTDQADVRLHLGILARDHNVINFIEGYDNLTGGVERARALLECLGETVVFRQSFVHVGDRPMRELTEAELNEIPDSELKPKLLDVSLDDFDTALVCEWPLAVGTPYANG
ncbi:hypothetical protein CMUS01_14886 [Colletotrichum musicola]|uniref:Uncharacterized protein n=1 Tax=Colletotrichum musicola TaxID=2175873 RepID=A0A8H6J1A9_9PEZI|nr:hypothetical protein CMUS01_14886 [Colletotrichum musicola]